ncbi:hypothetical protein C7B65_01670 [Phormidesmis priestleyi ULC007]|uniref:Uncharacterized protein n=1 Tax=Phormidesmis priestleyi ULC007 TaxID=1920490 RepID=A0A2T1DNU4_9CYAN|nr:hypothetical protein [Phormidesmis priestleyi]PSB22139.1 hypothetical protein C7B65_01670 [Phormidesmis priestleyi ULC007]PZO52599.1 MAG: hypothetical protein DCF14_06525 [Phormidesmis priestleyi]
MNLPFVLDVAIGLVFIYLILSLLASEVQELITTLLQWRAKHLKESIEILLGGGVELSEHQTQVKTLVDELYNDPLLQNVNQGVTGGIARWFRQFTKLFPGNRRGAYGEELATGPSYIAPETFATSLLERLGISKLINKLTEVRLEKFATRLVGIYKVNDNGGVEIPTRQEIKDNWEAGKIRQIVEQANPDQADLSTDSNFVGLVTDYHEILKDFRIKQATLKTCVERMGESLDRFIVAGSPTNPEAEGVPLIGRLKSFKLGIFGADNERAIVSGGLRPSLSEIADMVNQSSDVYREITDAYATVKTKLPPINAKIDDSVKAQLDAYNNSEDPPLTLKLSDLTNEQRDLFRNAAIREISEEEYALYQDYQSYVEIQKGLGKLPNAVRESLAVLARRAQTRVKQTESDINQLREEVSLWFDRSMSRTSGVYKRNAKGVAILIGITIASFTNSDTFHVFNRLSSDENLRQVITKRASDVISPATSGDRPPLRQELDNIRNQTDSVLRNVALPISWNPANLSKQFDCPPAAPINRDNVTSEQEWATMFASCLNRPPEERDISFFKKIGLTAQVAFRHPWEAFKMLLGWVLSGIAIAMGAPFWFDLLNRFVNVRNTGNKPKAAPEQSPPA